ncbi:MAG TPA: isoprenylcysteine carboxylmethyltransferase family protein [Pyrinomonadaceae bacterium]|nr:isoprenylcysteine carboxylmethyltransferase family protein [Pyrinomonadaceae bacterium]
MKKGQSYLYRFIIWLCTVGIITGLMLLLAGRWDLPLLWIYAAIFSFNVLARIYAMDADLAREERKRLPDRVDSRGSFALGLLSASHMVVAILDRGRFHWSDTVPLWLQLTALAGFALSLNLDVWARAVNNYFTVDVRLQRERGHHVVMRGPYRYIRHPGYTSALVSAFLSALALGSWVALIPAAIYALVLLRRTILEDRFLRENLEGYSSYTTQVRYRLLPGLW